MEAVTALEKIFDITKKLDIILPQELFIETLHVMESVLENHTFAFYSVGKNQSYGTDLQIAFPRRMTGCVEKIHLSGRLSGSARDDWCPERCG